MTAPVYRADEAYLLSFQLTHSELAVCFAICRAETFDPTTKRQSGPKAYPAEAPTKYRFGTEDSNHSFKKGEPLCSFTFSSKD
jgi:hypothetical protein